MLIGSLLRDRATLAVSFDLDIFENSPNVCDCFVTDGGLMSNESDDGVGGVIGLRYSSE